MKKLILASTIAALSVTAAQAAPTLYGKAGIGLTYTDEVAKGADKLTLDNDSTRIGVKGGEAITANTKAIYQLEYALKTDEGTADFVSRDTFVGFQNAEMGTLKAGNLSGIDGTADLTAGPKFSGVGVDFTDEDGEEVSLSTFGSSRTNDSLVYTTGDMGGLELKAKYVLNDSAALGGSYALAGALTSGAVKAGASYTSYKDDTDALRVSGSLDLSPALTLAAMYQVADFDEEGSKKENLLSASVAYDVVNTPWDVAAQVDLVDNLAGMDDVEGQTISASANYKFTSATKAHVSLGATDVEDYDNFKFGVGIVHSF